MARLDDALTKLGKEEGIEKPSYDRSQVTAGIVHIGPSHFARGHLFLYFDDILKDDLTMGCSCH